MDNRQQKVNELANILRKQVIAVLILEDRRKFGAAPLSKDEYEWTAMKIYEMAVPTRMLKRLFEDCHEMQNDKGQMLHAANVGELEWCIKNRCIGYRSTLNVRHGWLPKKEDKELRRLPAFVELSKIYTNANHVIAPIPEQNPQQAEIAQICNAMNIKKVG